MKRGAATTRGLIALSRVFSSLLAVGGLAALFPVAASHHTAAQSAEGRFLVLLGGTLIDGTGADPVPDAAVVIHGERVSYAGSRHAIELPSDALIVDIEGLTVLPGFINAHVHRGFNTGNRRSWAREGVTTVRDLGSDPASLASSLRRLSTAPELARLVAAGPLITVPGGYPIVPFGSRSALVVGSDTAARQQAEQLLDDGAGLLKLALETGTVFGRVIPVLPRSRASLLVRIAHGRGMVVSAHITSVADIELALDAGIDDLAHMAVDRPLPEALTERIVAAGVIWVPTLELWRCTGQQTMAVDNLASFVAAGGSVALGTDFAGYTCSFQLGMPILEMELMKRAGMSPMQIIVAATAHGARVCNLERELGTLGKGKIADLIVVAGDPLADLAALQEVLLVMRGGVTIRNEISELRWLSPREPADRHSAGPDPEKCWPVLVSDSEQAHPRGGQRTSPVW